MQNLAALLRRSFVNMVSLTKKTQTLIEHGFWHVSFKQHVYAVFKFFMVIAYYYCNYDVRAMHLIVVSNLLTRRWGEQQDVSLQLDSVKKKAFLMLQIKRKYISGISVLFSINIIIYNQLLAPSLYFVFADDTLKGDILSRYLLYLYSQRG